MSDLRRIADRQLLGRVWTALRWQGFIEHLQLLVGAAMYPTYRCGSSDAAGHNAIRAAQVPIDSTHSKCTAQLGSPDPAVSTGFVHQLLFALSNLVGDPRALSRSMR
jgi:hypothetical protein